MYTYKIIQDTDPLNPREDFDPLGEMLCFHKRYVLGDKHSYRAEQFDGWDEFLNELLEDEDPALVWLPIYMYDHGGITISTGSYSCPWDSGQIGFVIARGPKIDEYMGAETGAAVRRVVEDRGSTEDHLVMEKVEAALRAEVELYNQFLTGDCWGYVIFERPDDDSDDDDDDDNPADSCWGFYGHDDCEEEAKSVIKSLEEQDLADAALVAKRFGGAGASGPGCQA